MSSRKRKERLACFGGIGFIGLALTSCTKTERTSSTTHPNATAPVSNESSNWRPNEELERTLRGLDFEKDAAENLSDAAVLRLGQQSFLVVVSDEGHDFGVMTLGSDAQGKLYDLAELPRGDLAVELPRPKSKVEVDIEAVATAGNHVFLIGSASLKRKKPKEGDHAGKRLEEIVPASGAGADYSNYVYELRAHEGDGGLPDFELVGARDAREMLLRLPLIATFKDVPSKDNGLDVEGAAVSGGYFYFGLRGPVLRGRAVVVRTRPDFSEPETYTLDLRGLGVRALTAHGEDGQRLYVLAGPTLPREDDFELFRFTAADKRPEDVRATDVTLVASVPSMDGKRPEGLFALGTELCTVSDGVVGGDPRCRAF